MKARVSRPSNRDQKFGLLVTESVVKAMTAWRLAFGVRKLIRSAGPMLGLGCLLLLISSGI